MDNVLSPASGGLEDEAMEATLDGYVEEMRRLSLETKEQQALGNRLKMESASLDKDTQQILLNIFDTMDRLRGPATT